MTQYAKIINSTLEFAPRDKGGISNWINDEEAVLAEGYLPYEPAEYPTDGKRYNTTYEEQDGKIVTVYVELPFEKEEVDQIRATLYRNEVDPLMSEYNRKKTFNLFDGNEEAELLAKIEAKVAEIKETNPYPVVDESSEAEGVGSKMENTIEEID